MANPRLRFRRADGSEYPNPAPKTLADIATYVRKTTAGPRSAFVGTDNMKRDCAGVAFADSPEQVKGIAFTQGDVLVSNVRPYLKKAWLADREGVCSADVLCIRPTANVRNDYLYALLSNDPFFRYVMRSAKGSKMPRGDKTAIISMPLLLPCLEEQAKIAAFLSAVDDVIAATSREVADLELAKRGAMQRIFSQEVRFLRDDGSAYPEWETRRLSEFITSSSRKNTSNEDLEIYSVNNQEGFVSQDDQFDKAGYLKGISKYKYQIVEPGEFAYNPARINVGSIGLLREDAPVLVSPMYAVFKVSGDISAEYLLRWLKSENFQKIVRRYSAGSVRQTLMLPTLLEVTTPIPCLEEQAKIAEFLTAMDTAIAKAKTELDLWRLLKRSLAQQMFA